MDGFLMSLRHNSEKRPRSHYTPTGDLNIRQRYPTSCPALPSAVLYIVGSNLGYGFPQDVSPIHSNQRKLMVACHDSCN